MAYINISSTKKVNRLKLRGFTLGMAMIISGALLSMSLAMSTLLLRDLKIASITERSSIAYNIADSMMSCIVSYENNIKRLDTDKNEVGTFISSSLPFAYDNSYQETYTGNYRNYTDASITCMGQSVLDTTNPDPLNRTEIVAANAANSPAAYNGGVKTTINIQTQFMKEKQAGACGKLDIYANSSSDKMMVASGRVPCTGGSIVERSVVRVLR